MIGQLCQDLREIVWCWWSSDRIRVSPRDGQFLRVKPGDLLTLDGTDAVVLERNVSVHNSICLTCRTEAGFAELHVTMFSGRESAELLWTEAGGSRSLLASDIQVWTRSSNR